MVGVVFLRLSLLYIRLRFHCTAIAEPSAINTEVGVTLFKNAKSTP